MRATLLLCALGAVLSWVAPAIAEDATPTESPWEQLAEEDGIVVAEREVEGRDMPTFRGIGIVHASIYEILAVMNKVERYPEWMHKCIEAEVLEDGKNFTRIVYNRTDAPWPVWDRDTVLRTRLELLPEKNMLMAHFKSDPKNPHKAPVDGVVRMVRLEGFYKMTWLSEKKTRVHYQVDVDPGGSLPTWLAKLASRDLPLHTLANLRRQVKEAERLYMAFLKEWDPKHGGRGIPGIDPRSKIDPNQAVDVLKSD